MWAPKEHAFLPENIFELNGFKLPKRPSGLQTCDRTHLVLKGPLATGVQSVGLSVVDSNFQASALGGLVPTPKFFFFFFKRKRTNLEIHESLYPE